MVMDKRLGDVHLSTAAYERLIERLAQAEAKVRAVEAILSDVTDESAADGYVALADARGNRLSQIRAALSGEAAPRTDGDTR